MTTYLATEKAERLRASTAFEGVFADFEDELATVTGYRPPPDMPTGEALLGLSNDIPNVLPPPDPTAGVEPAALPPPAPVAPPAVGGPDVGTAPVDRAPSPTGQAPPLGTPIDVGQPVTTVDLGAGARRENVAGLDRNSLIAQIGGIARSLLGSDEAGRVAQAIVVTEGGLTGAVGDLEGGGSYGPFQFYWQGQLGNFARDMGMGLREAAEYARTHPAEAAQWALQPDKYLGAAIRRGLAQGLTGADLATYVQRTGQVSVSPERAGQNYAALFGGGGGPGFAAAPMSTGQGPFDALGSAARGVADTAGRTAGDLFSAFDRTLGEAISGPVATATQTAGDLFAGFNTALGEAMGGLRNPLEAPALQPLNQRVLERVQQGGLDPGDVIQAQQDTIGRLADLVYGASPGLTQAAEATGTDPFAPIRDLGLPLPDAATVNPQGIPVAKGLFTTAANVASGAAATGLRTAGPAGQAAALALDPQGEALAYAAPVARALRGADTVPSPTRAGVQASEPGGRILYHGTGSAFDAPTPDKFDPNGLFGPGYYLTSDARVAGSYSEARAPFSREIPADMLIGRAAEILRERYPAARPGSPIGDAIAEAERVRGLWRPGMAPAEEVRIMGGLEEHIQRSFDVNDAFERASRELGSMGSNVRPVEVPPGLRLLDADAPAPADALAAVRATLTPADARRFDDYLSVPYQEGQRFGTRVPNEVPLEKIRDAYNTAMGASGSTQARLNTTLFDAGYDGIRYQGGKRIPMRADDGSPIEHEAVVIFPEALGKVRNALSGQPGGFLPSAEAVARPIARGAAQGAVAGAAQEQRDTGQVTPQGVLGGAALGAAAGGLRAAGPAGVRAAGTTARLVAETRAKTEPHGLTINLPKYVPEPVREVIQQAYDANPLRMDAARRGVMADSLVKELAEQTGESVTRVRSLWKPGQAKNAETIYALRSGLATASQDVLAAQKALKAAPQSADALNGLVGALTRHAAIQEVVTGVTAEAGRALRQFRLPVTGQEASLKQLQRLAKQWKVEPEEMAEALTKVDLADPAAVAGIARTLTRHSPGDKLTALWYFNLLSSPVTHIKNTVSNALTMAVGPLETAGAAVIDLPVALARGGRRERFFGEVPSQYVGMVAGFTDGARAALQIMRRGFSQAEVTQKLDLAYREPFRGRVADLTVNVPGRALRASDVLFRTMNRSATLYGEAYRRASQEGLKGQKLLDRVAEIIRSPTPEMLARAEKQAAYRVFQQDGEFVRAISSFRDRIPGARFVVPFVQTPYNLTKYALERTPLGSIGIATDLATKRLPAKGVGDLEDRLARVALGSGAMLSLYQFAEQGLMTGAAPRDAAERDAFFRQGKQPYSVLVGGEWRSYVALQPFAAIFAGAAAAAEARKRGNEADALTLSGLIAFSVARSVLDQPWTEGLSNFLDVMSGSNTRDPGDVLRSVKDYTEQQANAVVPAVVRWLERMNDPVVRDPDGPWEAIKAGIPGVAESVPAKLDAFGNPIRRPQGQQGAGGSLDISRPSTPSNDPVEKELARLQLKGYDVQPGFVGKRITAFRTPVTLTRDQQRRYQEEAGVLSYAIIADLVSDPGWSGLSDAEKARLVDRVVSRTRQYVRDQMEPELFEQAVDERVKQARQRAATP